MLNIKLCGAVLIQKLQILRRWKDIPQPRAESGPAVQMRRQRRREAVIQRDDPEQPSDRFQLYAAAYKLLDAFDLEDSSQPFETGIGRSVFPPSAQHKVQHRRLFQDDGQYPGIPGKMGHLSSYPSLGRGDGKRKRTFMGNGERTFMV